MATNVGKVSDVGFSSCWLFLGLLFLFLDAPKLVQPPQHNGHLTQQQHSYLRQCNLHLHYVPGTVTSANATYTYTMYLAQLPQAMQLTPTLCTQHSYLRQCNFHLHYVPGTVTSGSATYTYTMYLAQLPQAMQLTPTLCTWHSYLRQCSLHLHYVPGTVTSGNAAYTYTMYLAQLPQAMKLTPTLCTWHSYQHSYLRQCNLFLLLFTWHSYLRQCSLHLHYVLGTAITCGPLAEQLCHYTGNQRQWVYKICHTGCY